MRGLDRWQVEAQNKGKGVYVVQQHTTWPDRKEDFLVLPVAGHEGSAFFLGVGRAFWLGWLDLSCLPATPSLVLGSFF